MSLAVSHLRFPVTKKLPQQIIIHCLHSISFVVSYKFFFQNGKLCFSTIACSGGNLGLQIDTQKIVCRGGGHLGLQIDTHKKKQIVQRTIRRTILEWSSSFRKED